MWEQVDRILRQSAAQIADHVADFLPGVLVALLLMVAAVVAAVLARTIIVRALRGLEFDRRAEQLGIGPLSAWPGSTSTTQAVGVAAYWTILILGLLLSLTALNATIPSRLADAVFAYLPHLLAAFVILLIGAIAARFLARSVLIGAVNMQIQSARLLSLFVKWLVLHHRDRDGARSPRHRTDGAAARLHHHVRGHRSCRLARRRPRRARRRRPRAGAPVPRHAARRGSREPRLELSEGLRPSDSSTRWLAGPRAPLRSRGSFAALTRSPRGRRPAGSDAAKDDGGRPRKANPQRWP